MFAPAHTCHSFSDSLYSGNDYPPPRGTLSNEVHKLPMIEGCKKEIWYTFTLESSS